MEFLTLGSAPTEEVCAQVGSPDYEERSRKECRVFQRQLRRQFKETPDSWFCVKSFPHDFGSYREVCIAYNESVEEAEGLAFNVENNTPQYWDDQSKKELQ